MQNYKTEQLIKYEKSTTPNFVLKIMQHLRFFWSKSDGIQSIHRKKTSLEDVLDLSTGQLSETHEVREHPPALLMTPEKASRSTLVTGARENLRNGHRLSSTLAAHRIQPYLVSLHFALWSFTGVAFCCCCCYKGKARPSASKKSTTRFIAIFA